MSRMMAFRGPGWVLKYRSSNRSERRRRSLVVKKKCQINDTTPSSPSPLLLSLEEEPLDPKTIFALRWENLPHNLG
jgi:hypothetical protein